MSFNIRNKDSLDVRDTKMPVELVKAFYDLQIHSILDIGCGSGWICDYMPPSTFYVGFDKEPRAIQNAKKLHPEGHFIETTIENFPQDFEKHFSFASFDCAFLKCMFCTVPKELFPKMVEIITKYVKKYVFLYDTEKEPNIWFNLFTEAGLTLEFTHLRQSSHVQIWSFRHG